mgnify:CR=1 FL=1
MKLSALLFSAALLGSGVDARRPTWEQLDDYSFKRYQLDFGKYYDTPEEATRRSKIFYDNLEAIQAHNEAGHSWKKGVNRFTDMTMDERRQLRGLDRDIYFGELADRSANEWGMDTLMEKYPCGEETLPDFATNSSVDWRKAGVLTPVKNQGSCGRCVLEWIVVLFHHRVLTFCHCTPTM